MALGVNTYRHTLESLFPRKVEGLRVAHISNTHEELWAIYFLKGARDPDLNWERYLEHMEKYESLESPRFMKRPQDIMPKIYWNHSRAFDMGLVTPNDTILAGFDLCRANGLTLRLAQIDRRIPLTGPDEHKGEGIALYRNLAELMRKKGYRFLRLLPDDTERLPAHYARHGFVPVQSIRPDKICEIVTGDFSSKCMVHFFYEEDKAKFLKPEFL